MKTILVTALLLTTIILISGCTSTAETARYSIDSLPDNIEPANEGQLTPEGNSVGNKAPDFNLTATDGRMIRLSELTAQGKPVVLYFMTTWCPYCKEEYKNIEDAYKDNVEFISVGMDLNENNEMLEKYRTANGRPGSFAMGNVDMLKDYSVLYTTTKYVISREGVILYKSSGVLSADNWKVIFDSLQ